jgi:hypothetical protein
VDVVVFEQGRGGGLVFEVIEQWGRVEESDGRDAQGHSLILEEDSDTAIFAGML